MRYSDTNVSDWFRLELADFFVAALKEKGPMPKGALIAAVMEMRGLKPHAGNMLMRAHVDELQRRGILKAQRSLRERQKILIMSLSGVAEGGGSQPVVSGCSTGALSAVAHQAPVPVSGNVFGELIAGLASRMSEIAENTATQNEAIMLVMREVSAMREGIAMLLEKSDANFAWGELASANRHGEIARELSAIREAMVSSDAGASDYAVILVALEDLSRKINDPDDVVKRLDASHKMLRDHLGKQGSAVNHSAASASRG